ncbi:MAG: hypothetical protein Q9M22_06270 [Mariprofundaceae bacterium]|nr:hypothetical protein [Mariprofundaceae bacterium]
MNKYCRLDCNRHRTINIVCLIYAVVASVSFSHAAWAKPDVKISIEALKEVTVKKDGKTVIKRVPAKEAKPGDTVIFQLHYYNKGDETATNASLVDPIPLETTYVKDSAFGAGSVITFSADDGKHYATADALFKEKKLADGTIEKKIIAARFYTHIRWVIKEIPAGKGGLCSFHVELK